MNGAAVSQVQLAASMARVGDQLKKNSAAVGTVQSRVNTVRDTEKKDNEQRKNDLKSINEKIQLLAILPLLVKPAVKTMSDDVTDVSNNVELPKGTNVLVDSGDALGALLPFLLIGGLGSSGLVGGGESGSGGMDGSMLLVLALALGLGKK
jgi:hypothetical protein